MSDSIVDRLFETCQPDIRLALESRVRRLTDRCGSPIEIMFLVALDLGMGLMDWAERGCGDVKIARQGEPISTEDPKVLLTVIPQYQWNNFRIDFALFVGTQTTTPAVFIECDGHNFHERTAEQAEKDRSRDRAIQQAGIPIIRFTGREIYRDPLRCAEQAFTFVQERLCSK